MSLSSCVAEGRAPRRRRVVVVGVEEYRRRRQRRQEVVVEEAVAAERNLSHQAVEAVEAVVVVGEFH